MAIIIILAGGSSDEREVSLRSGAAVAKALRAKGHSAQILDPADHFERHKATVQAADAVFPALHGQGGEDGSIQSVLETWGVAYVGADVAASKLCFDKWRYKQYVRAHDLPVPAGELVNFATFQDSNLIKNPFVLKPFNGGSSVDTLIVRDVSSYNPDKVQALFKRRPQMLLETLIDGIEVTIGILGDQALPVVEIIPPVNGEFDYENKYNGQSQELCPPQHVNEILQQKVQQIALKAHRLAGCRDFSRSDIMIDKSGDAYLLETNTIPGLTEQSLWPKAAHQAGLEMPDAMDKLVRFTLGRRGY